MKSIGDMTRAELAALVQERLRAKGVEEILCGGSCVSIYSDETYVSDDLDLVHASLLSPRRRVIRETMLELGFGEEGRHFAHPETDLLVEFPPGPPSLGDEPAGKIEEMPEATGLLRLLSPTDCVKDRLACYFYFGDEQCLRQALLVARRRSIDMAEVGRWAGKEGREKRLRRFQDLLRG